ncbi:serine/threonine-protein kinase [Myxococcus fulvus]|uniref:serine/threonine-protein kinase n=1 Tax=Myxococcus fulvus TaxID=33 RepID=UPI00200ABC95|nr:serine/threonine-protein kinase [Myxococcus fulvus]MCK8499753.1 protein kinase [Myxococcus fulvus]
MTARERTTGAARGRAADSLLATQVGEYVIEERIGSGGMGVVYRAMHPLIGKQVAIKVLRAEFVSPRLEERLLVEARAVNAIRHAGLLDIFGFGRLADGRPYITMELLLGESLAAHLYRVGRVDVATTRWVLDKVLSALGAAHAAGVVHRDLKPGNIFLTETLEGVPTVKLVDFGIAKLLGEHDGHTTVDGTLLGTPEYMAPEQIRKGTISAATDLYALGIIAFQLLTGERPFKGEQVQVLFAQVEQPPPLPSSLVPDLPPEVDTLILHLLAKDPELRPSSAEEVRQALARIPTHDTPPPHEPRTTIPDALSTDTGSPTTRLQDAPPDTPGRWRLAVPIAALLFLCLAGGVTLWKRTFTRQEPAIVALPPPASRPLAQSDTPRVLPRPEPSSRELLREAPGSTNEDPAPVPSRTAEKAQAPTPPTRAPASRTHRAAPSSTSREPAGSRRDSTPRPPLTEEGVKELRSRLTTECQKAEQVLRAKVGNIANGSPALHELQALRQRIESAHSSDEYELLQLELARWKHSRLGPATGTSLRNP